MLHAHARARCTPATHPNRRQRDLLAQLEWKALHTEYLNEMSKGFEDYMSDEGVEEDDLYGDIQDCLSSDMPPAAKGMLAMFIRAEKFR